MKSLSLVFICLSYYESILAKDSFEIKFQSSGNWSPNEWVEFEKYIPQLKEKGSEQNVKHQ